MMPRLAVFAGATATILNTEPLVTSNKARAKHGKPLLLGANGEPTPVDTLRPQRLAAPVTIYIEQFSAHPLEKDSAHLYAPPDGYLNRYGRFHRNRDSPEDTPVYEVELRPDDGLYQLPYMALQADGEPWDGDCSAPADDMHCRQTSYPDASRLFEEIDRFGIGLGGRGSTLSSRAQYDFFRAAPPGGFRRGLEESQRTDQGVGDIAPEVRGVDFFPYRPRHLASPPPAASLATITNLVQNALDEGDYLGALWLEGSPHVEETLYWLGLLISTDIPIVGHVAHRAHGSLGADGDRNILDGVNYILSRAWVDSAGHDRIGPVLIQDQLIITARDAYKADARPGAFRAGGGTGGVLGIVQESGNPLIAFRPERRFTRRSEVNMRSLPTTVAGVQAHGGRVVGTTVQVLGDGGTLLPDALPMVTIFKHGRYMEDGKASSAAGPVEILARVQDSLERHALSGLVAEGNTPYAAMSAQADAALSWASFSGIPVVKVGRGVPEGPTASARDSPFISGSNLSATKARVLLMACLIRFGALPPAADPASPTPRERNALREKLDSYQDVFDSH